MKRVALVALAALLLYFPAANAVNGPITNSTGCLDVQGKGKGKVSKVAPGDSPLGGSCPTGYDEIKIGSLPEGCTEGQVAKYSQLLPGWVCAPDNSDSKGVAFRAFSASNQALSPGNNVVSLGAENFDLDEDFEASTFTAPRAGTYRFEGRVETDISGAVTFLLSSAGELCRGSESAPRVSVITCLAALDEGTSVQLNISVGNHGIAFSGSPLTYLSGTRVADAFFS